MARVLVPLKHERPISPKSAHELWTSHSHLRISPYYLRFHDSPDWLCRIRIRMPRCLLVAYVSSTFGFFGYQS